MHIISVRLFARQGTADNVGFLGVREAAKIVLSILRSYWKFVGNMCMCFLNMYDIVCPFFCSDSLHIKGLLG